MSPNKRNPGQEFDNFSKENVMKNPLNSTKSRRKKVTVIRKKKQRDGSITTSKQTIYGVTVS